MHAESAIHEHGPAHGIEGLLERVPLRRQLAFIIGLGWVPLAVCGLIANARGQAEPLLRDPAVHVRVLVAVPLLLIAARVFDNLADRVTARLSHEGFIADADRARFNEIGRRHEVLRDSTIVDIVILALAVGGAILRLVGTTSRSGHLHTGSDSLELTATTAVYACLTLPLFQAVLARGLWRFCIWAYFLLQVARLDLQLMPSHPDQRVGLEFLKQPSHVYAGIVLFAVSCVAAAAWGPAIFAHEIKIKSIQGVVIALFVSGIVIALAPLLAFLPKIIAERVRAQIDYGALASDYSRAFQSAWISERTRAHRRPILGNADFQSLSDLSQFFRNTILSIHPLLFDVRDLVVLAVATLLPLAPLALAEIPAEQLLSTVMHLATGVR